MIRRKRRGGRQPAEPVVTEAPEATGDVWPAYVDVLASAFAFMLLAFLATLTKETKAREEVEVQVGGELRERALRHDAFLLNLGAWGARHGALDTQIKGDLASRIGKHYFVGNRPCSEVIPLASLCTLASTDLRSTLDAAKANEEARVALEYRYTCTLADEELKFKSGEAEPESSDRTAQVLACLAEMAKDLKDHSCCDPADPRPCSGGGADGESWCAVGLDVEGHADCVPFTGSDKTNWELSSARAGFVIRRMSERAKFLPTEQFRVKATGFERQQQVDQNCNCEIKNDKCHTKNRRVVVNFVVRSAKSMEPRPVENLR